MLVFIGLIIIISSIVGLIRGSVFKGSILKIKELSDDYHKNFYARRKEAYIKNIAPHVALFLLGTVFLSILHLVFYISVIDIPVLTFLTLIMMINFIITYVFASLDAAKKKKNKIKVNTPLDAVVKDKQNAKDLAELKTRSAIETTNHVMYIMYFSLAVWVLIQGWI